MKLRVSEVAHTTDYDKNPVSKIVFTATDEDYKENHLSQYLAMQFHPDFHNDTRGFEVGEEYEISFELVPPDTNPSPVFDPKTDQAVEEVLKTIRKVEIN